MPPTFKSAASAAGRTVNNTNPNVILAVGAIVLGYVVVQKIFKKKKPNIGPGYEIPAGATLTISAALEMSDAIKNALQFWSYGYHWNVVAAQFEKLQNSSDVKMLFDAFGVAPTPPGSGDLWQFLNWSKDKDLIAVGDYQYWATIKQHSFDYALNLDW